jgi:poly(3-hydroxyoctanoate) depolymerase
MTTAFRGRRRVGGVRLFVDSQPGEGTPLVLCNGLGSNLELLQPLVDRLATRPGRPIPVIRFDVPGSGGSPSTRLPGSMPRLADLVADLVADLGYESADVLGLSWGGALAQEFAHRHPRSCRRIVLCATSMGMIGVPPKPSALLTAAGPLSFFGARDIRQTGARIYGGGFGDDPAVADRLAAALRAPDPVGYLWQTLAWMGWTSAHYLPTLRQPALVVAGDEDPLIPTVNARMIALLLRRGRLRIVPGGGHLALLTHADDVVPLIHDFLTESEPRGLRSSSVH